MARATKRIIDSALVYREKLDLAVIPVCTAEKKAQVTFLEWQDTKPDISQVQKWFSRDWPKAKTVGIAILTGKINNLTVVDLDYHKMTEEEKASVSKKVSPEFTPTAHSAGGGIHKYYQYCPDLPNKAGVLPHVDIRNNSGYIIAPPSKNGKHGYEWKDRVDIKDTPVNSISLSFKEHILLYIRNSTILYSKDRATGDLSTNDLMPSTQRLQLPTSVHIPINWDEGHRDQTLFHIVNHLVKGKMPLPSVQEVLRVCALNCNPPFPDRDIPEKIKSALKRVSETERNLTADIKDWLSLCSGTFLSTDVHRELQLSTRRERKTASTALARLCEQGIIEKHGDRRGQYRIKEAKTMPMTLEGVSRDNRLDIRWPLGAERFFYTTPKNIIIYSGEQDSGKTAFALNFISLNYKRPDVLPIYYFQNEMSPEDLSERLELFEDFKYEGWKAFEKTENFHDEIRPDGINVIDYLSEIEKAYMIGKRIEEIWSKLNKGIAIIMLQKETYKEIARGGGVTLDKARAYFTIKKGFPHEISITKMKNWQDPEKNPKGYTREFKLIAGSKIFPESDWYLPTK